MTTRQTNIDQNILKLVWNNTNDAIFTIGYDGRILSANPAFTSILGWVQEDFNKHNCFPFFSNMTDEEHKQLLSSFKEGNDIPYYVTKRKRKDGIVLDILASYRAINKGEVLAVGMYKDFTEQMEIQRRLQASEDCYRNLVEFIPDSIFIEKNGQITFVNQPAIKLVGAATAEEIIGKPISQLVPENMSQQFLNRIRESSLSNKPIIEQIYRFDGTHIWGEIITMQIEFKDDKVLQILVRDVTAKKNYQQQLEYLAYHDPLTGLSNRRYFTEQINRELEQDANDSKILGIMYIDLDRFKAINDSLGHEIGDQLLKQFAIRLKESVRNSDIICRVGGDEFLVLLNGLNNKNDAAIIASKLNNESKKPFIINNTKIEISSSIGISLFPQDGIDSKKLIQRSDEALYKAKITRNTYQFYDESNSKL
ncbi:sensor domain-containing protein [Ureibacillus acetophenoni]|uniref:PAS domain S-box-containing protein/diguanylate cyclase (GGDEF)-like protein n=1 Tax=Ureibacillus acetophenoni TaxID=614649 RepID=A0A285UL40_9BACL|nr:diguanylate cyclase [Ureibacillus acetophenoni]SOC42569.1 PAS domain S-box-containing protein/diguanylate cyclase (GGDEF)-like protein [Ureibacillus acetophenoni]